MTQPLSDEDKVEAGAQLRPRDELLAMIDPLVSEFVGGNLVSAHAALSALSEAAERIRADAKLAAEVAKYRSYPSAAPMWDILNDARTRAEAAESKLKAAIEAIANVRDTSPQGTWVWNAMNDALLHLQSTSKAEVEGTKDLSDEPSSDASVSASPAADAVAALLADRDRLEGALEPFARYGSQEDLAHLPDELVVSMTYDDSAYDEDLGGPNTLLGEPFLRCFRLAARAVATHTVFTPEHKRRALALINPCSEVEDMDAARTAHRLAAGQSLTSTPEDGSSHKNPADQTPKGEESASAPDAPGGWRGVEDHSSVAGCADAQSALPRHLQAGSATPSEGEIEEARQWLTQLLNGVVNGNYAAGVLAASLYRRTLGGH